MGGLRKTDYSDSATPDISRTYDADGNLLSTSRPQATWNYQYDELNNPLREDLSIDNKLYTIQYSYDTRGHLVQRQLPLGHTINYTVDGIGRTTQVNRLTTPVVSGIAYHPSDEIQSMAFANGQNFSQTLTERLKPLRVRSAKSSPGVVAFDQILTYTARDQISNRNDIADQNNSSSYTYDEMGRLITANNLQYTYDGIGNLRRTTNGPQYVATDYTGNRAFYSWDNSTSTVRTFHYDTRGNTTEIREFVGNTGMQTFHL